MMCKSLQTSVPKLCLDFEEKTTVNRFSRSYSNQLMHMLDLEITAFVSFSQDQKKRQFREYYFLFHLSGAHIFSVKGRFSMLRAAHMKLSREFNDLPKFPSRHVLCDMSSDKNLANRRMELTCYMTAMSKRPDVLASRTLHSVWKIAKKEVDALVNYSNSRVEVSQQLQQRRRRSLEEMHIRSQTFWWDDTTEYPASRRNSDKPLCPPARPSASDESDYIPRSSLSNSSTSFSSPNDDPNTSVDSYETDSDENMSVSSSSTSGSSSKTTSLLPFLFSSIDAPVLAYAARSTFTLEKVSDTEIIIKGGNDVTWFTFSCQGDNGVSTPDWRLANMRREPLMLQRQSGAHQFTCYRVLALNRSGKSKVEHCVGLRESTSFANVFSSKHPQVRVTSMVKHPMLDGIRVSTDVTGKEAAFAVELPCGDQTLAASMCFTDDKTMTLTVEPEMDVCLWATVAASTFSMRC